jgi:hypothetical protein
MAFMADALCALANEGTKAPKVTVFAEVTAEAFDRGYTVAGERSMIRGIGPVPVSTVKTLARRGTIKRIARDAHDVTRVKVEGRYIPAKILAAVRARDAECVVPGCHRIDLEIDHILPLEDGGITELRNLCGLCVYHHYLKTHHGYQISGPPGQWSFEPPPPGGKRKRRSK